MNMLATRHKQLVSSPLDSARVLVVDDELTIRAALTHALSAQGYEVTAAVNGQVGLDAVREDGPFDVALVDLSMPVIDGLSFLKQAQGLDPGMSVIMMTGHASVRTAVESLKLGALDYLTKPFEQIFAIGEQVLPRALEASRQRRSVTELVACELDERDGVFEGMIGRSEPIKRVYELIAGVAPTDATVLIQGETGTGKELVARAIHNRSARQEAPFVALNCAAVPSELLESELFGHEKGAFTNAVAAKKGLFEEANRGTLFLDEIAEMSPALQAKLLRVLQEGEIRRVGSSKTLQVDVRILAATHRDLREALKEGAFREDLYYRLAVVVINVPPLRERADDIPLLAGQFLREFSANFGRTLIGFDAEAMVKLQQHLWEGNVRELRNVVERSTIFARGHVIKQEHLPDELQAPSPTDHPRSTTTNASFLTSMEFIEAKQAALKNFERHYVHSLLERTEGNISQAAREAGMDRSNFRRLLKRLGS